MKPTFDAIAKILIDVPDGRAWLAELIETLVLEGMVDNTAGEIFTGDRAAAAIVSQLLPNHCAALATILLSDRIRQEMRPNGG